MLDATLWVPDLGKKLLGTFDVLKVLVFIAASTLALPFAYLLRRRRAAKAEERVVRIPKRVSLVAAVMIWLPCVLIFGLALFIPRFSLEIVVIGAAIFVVFLRWTGSESARGLLSGWKWLYEGSDGD